MSLKTRDALYAYFKAEAIPTERNFADLIDSFINQVEDGISMSPLQNVKIGNPTSDTGLSIAARWNVLPGKLTTLAKDPVVKGIGTNFMQHLEEGEEIIIKNAHYRIKRVIDNFSLELAVPALEDLKEVDVRFRSDILSVENTEGKTLFYISRKGLIGVNKNDPEKALDIHGDVKASGTIAAASFTGSFAGTFSGDGSNLSVSASKIDGTIPLDKLPPLVWPGKVEGLLTIENEYVRPIAGTVTGTKGTKLLTGEGTDFTALSAGQAIFVGKKSYKIAAVSGNALALQSELASEINKEKVYTEVGDFLSMKTGFEELLGVNGKGDLHTSGTIQSSGFIGEGSALTHVTASKLEGQITAENMPPFISNLAIHAKALQRLPLTGTVSISEGSDKVTGKGTKFTQEVKTSQTITISGESYQVDSIESDTSLTLIRAVDWDKQDVQASIEANALEIQDAEGRILFYITKDGFVQTIGTVQATSFSGDGSGLSNLDASQLSGMVSPENLPSPNEIDGSLSVNGTYRAVPGTVSGKAGQAMLAGSEDFLTEGLKIGQKALIGETLHEIARIEENISVTLKEPLAEDLDKVILFTTGNLLELNFDGKNLLKVDKDGNVEATSFTASETISAKQFAGDGSQLSNLPAPDFTAGLTTPGEINAGSFKGGKVDISGNITSGETISAKQFTGDGSRLSNLPAPDFTAGLTTPGEINAGSFKGGSAEITGNITSSETISAKQFQGDGSRLSNLPAPDFTAGLTTPGAINAGSFKGGSADITGNITSSETIAAKQFTGDGSRLSNLPAPDFKNGLTTPGEITAGSFKGSGAGLTNISGAAIKGNMNTEGLLYALGFDGDAAHLRNIPSSEIRGNRLRIEGEVEANNFKGSNIDINGNIKARSIESDNFRGNGAGLTNISASSIRGDISVENLNVNNAVKARRFFSDEGEVAIRPLAHATVSRTFLENGEPAIFSWEVYEGINEVVIEYLFQGKVKRLSSRTGDFRMNEKGYALSLYKEVSVVTFTAYRQGRAAYMQQWTISVVQKFAQYATQMNDEGIGLEHLLKKGTERFRMKLLGRTNVAELASVALTAGYSHQEIMDGVRKYYQDHGFQWGPDYDELLLDVISTKIVFKHAPEVRSYDDMHYGSGILGTLKKGTLLKIKIDADLRDHTDGNTGGSNWGIRIGRKYAAVLTAEYGIDNPGHKPMKIRELAYTPNAPFEVEEGDIMVVYSAQVYGGHLLVVSNTVVTLYLAK